MALRVGTRLGPYEIAALLGVGGMGEVYRARDSRLDRSVAIKVLPEHFASDKQRRERFQREAKVVSSLSHPHICSVHDIGEESGVHYLVLEHLEGETLADRLTSGPMQPSEALRIAAQVASALDAAHRSGVVHRDLKPANVMLTRSGAKLLDFGLAKPLRAFAASAATDATATVSKSLTEEGTIVGTFQYMAPEQLQGTEADGRSDIFALGAVLYEMLAGKPAFCGSSRASLIASILTAEPPPIPTTSGLSGPVLDHVVRTCLAKDPEARYQSAHDLLLEINWVIEAGSSIGAAPVKHSRRNLGLGVTAVVASCLLLALAVFLWPTTPPVSPTLRASFAPPVGRSYDPTMAALSPDGEKVVFRSPETGTGASALWLLDLTTGVSRPLPDTDNADIPFWSPDSNSVGFVRSGKLMRVGLQGAPAGVVADVSEDLTSAAWGSSGTIVMSAARSISAVSADGGRVRQVLDDSSSRADSGLSFLPDGRHFLVGRGLTHDPGFYLLDLGSPEQKFLFDADTFAVYADPGYLLFDRAGVVYAQPFSLRKLALEGDPVTLVDKVNGPVSVSKNRVLAFFATAEAAKSELRWIARSGRVLDRIGQALPYGMIRLSPGGDRLAYVAPDLKGQSIWIYDLARDASTRVTFSGMAENPVWSPDGQRIAFTRYEDPTISVKAASGLGAEEVLLDNAWPTDWSPDGRFIAYNVADSAGVRVGILQLAPEKKHELLNPARAGDRGARFSPDGQLLAYTSSESGRSR